MASGAGAVGSQSASLPLLMIWGSNEVLANRSPVDVPA